MQKTPEEDRALCRHVYSQDIHLISINPQPAITVVLVASGTVTASVLIFPLTIWSGNPSYLRNSETTP